MDNVKRFEEAGAGALVYKSLFEEQIQYEGAQLQDELDEYAERNAEMVSLFPNLKHAGPEEHLVNLRKTKENIGIPLIASLNAIYKETWVEYAELVEQTGVDALELNFYAVPKEMNTSGEESIQRKIAVIKAIKEKVNIPVSIKLSPFYANPLHVISQMDQAGADGFVLFNRLFQPDIDMDKEEHFTPFNLSSPEDHKLPLRFAGLLYQNIKASICSNSGIFSGTDVAKMILAGATCTQVVSTVYKNKIDYISTIISDLEAWMDSKGYKSLNDFRGKLSKHAINDPFIYKRAQYIDVLLKSDQIFKKYPVR
jgi:dihydroorotate dehydrogenase (fumarate)